MPVTRSPLAQLLDSADNRVRRGKLLSWDDIANAPWSNLLLGNGSSIAVSAAFGYSSLKSIAIKHADLTPSDDQIFSEFHTTNFEEVLGALQTAIRVQAARAKGTRALEETYDRIREALVRAVHSVHVRFDDAEQSGTLGLLASALRQYGSVFTLNYDLLLYWARMSCDDAWTAFKDYFWTNPFDIADTGTSGSPTTVLYLHGGLHLVRTRTGRTKKRTNHGASLLETFGRVRSEIPLFISEGSSKSKLRAILRNDYLTFAREQLGQCQGKVVVFGFGFGRQDHHIVKLMQRWESRTVAISVRDRDPVRNRREMRRIQAQLPSASILFFDAPTHPLGDTALAV